MPLPIYPASKEAEARLALRSTPSNVLQFFAIYLPTGEILGATNYAQPIFDPMLGCWYRADLGAGPSSSETSIDPSRSGNSNLTLFFVSESLSEAIVGSGLLDGARWEHFMAPPDLSWRMPKGAGWVAEVTEGGQDGPGAINLSFVGMEQVLSGDILETTGTMCRYELGDERCGVDVSVPDRNGKPIQKTGLSVSEVGNNANAARSDKRSLRCSALGSDPDGHWSGARVRFSTGNNAAWGWFPVERSGASTLNPNAIPGSHGPGWIEFSLPLPNVIQVGDQFEIWAGCNKILLGDCKNRYNNVKRFGGESDIPQETIYQKEKDD